MPFYSIPASKKTATLPEFSKWTENGEYPYYRSRVHAKMDNPMMSSISVSIPGQPSASFSYRQTGQSTIPDLTKNPYSPNIQ